jgi:hypothetical protein
MDFIFSQIYDIEVVLPELLQTAQVLLTDRMPLAEGRPLELSGRISVISWASLLPTASFNPIVLSIVLTPSRKQD